jgi:hypothetical protein
VRSMLPFAAASSFARCPDLPAPWAIVGDPEPASPGTCARLPRRQRAGLQSPDGSQTHSPAVPGQAFPSSSGSRAKFTAIMTCQGGGKRRPVIALVPPSGSYDSALREGTKVV